jgi:hypothetical protein
MEVPKVHPNVFSHFSSMVTGDALGISVDVGIGVGVGATDAFVKFVRNELLSSI